MIPIEIKRNMEPQLVNPFQSSVKSHIGTSHFDVLRKSKDWLKYEMQHWPT